MYKFASIPTDLYTTICRVYRKADSRRQALKQPPRSVACVLLFIATAQAKNIYIWTFLATQPLLLT